MSFALAAAGTLTPPDSLGGAPAPPRDVVRGTDDFLFHCFAAAFEQLCSGTEPTDKQLLEWVLVIESNFAWCKANNVNFVTLIIPERHIIYADKLPAPYTVSSNRPVSRVMKSIGPCMHAAVLYPEAALKDARKTGDVFLKTDEHLNLHGVYACYRALIDHLSSNIAITPVDRDALEVEHLYLSGNLGMRMEDEPMEFRDHWTSATRTRTARTFQNRNGRGRVELFENANQTLPRAIVYGDSTLDEMKYLLVENFSRTVIVYHCSQFFYDLVRREKPDVVVHFMTELRLGLPYADGAIGLPNGDFLLHCGEPLPAHLTLFTIDCGKGGGSAKFMGDGWSLEERDYTWMTDYYSFIALPREAGAALASSDRRFNVAINLVPLTRASLSRHRQRLEISCGYNDKWIDVGTFEINGDSRLQVALPQIDRRADQTLWLRFAHPDGFSPLEYGSADPRILSLAVRRITIFEAPPSPSDIKLSFDTAFVA
jgi:alginate O-acetyltransferase complex protein AlgJ